ncbi:MAG: type II toxin-antitoxin system VapB family antitoxin [Nitrospira sp.]|nr:type II toxin-antitoxin system VapB family antitoxin [Nitrospira sp.]MDE0487316.1 type II toxin-antitoxin system VapB family antitoxin [Nitrospira sp.]
MPLNIKDADTQALTKRLASLTGESLTQAVKQAVRERLAQVEKTRRALRLADELDYIALNCANLPRRDKRSAEQIVGYDERGLPV